MTQSRCMTRRGLVAALAGTAVGGPVFAAAPTVPPHDPGPVNPPILAPDVDVTLSDGTTTRLVSVLRGKLTAVQFVLTGCGSICPLLGVIFSRAQDRLASETYPYQFLSLSLSPVSDTPQSLAKWLSTFGAGPRWLGAIPKPDSPDLIDLLAGWGLDTGSTPDSHTENVLIFNPRAELVFRFPDLPDPDHVAAVMHRLSGLFRG